jgi:hypothetical protein
MILIRVWSENMKSVNYEIKKHIWEAEIMGMINWNGRIQ